MSESPSSRKQNKQAAIGGLVGLLVVGVAVVALGASLISLLPIFIGGMLMLGLYAGYFSDRGD